MGVLDPPPQRTGGCGGPRPRCSAASPPQRRPKPQPCLSRECVSSRSAAEAVPASDTERETALDGWRMGVLDPPPQRTGGCGGPRPRCSAASPPQRRPKWAALPEQRVWSCRSAAEAVPASVTERETPPDGRRIEPNHGRNRPLTPTYGRAALKCSAAPAAEQSRRSTFGRRAASTLLGASHDVRAVARRDRIGLS